MRTLRTTTTTLTGGLLLSGSIIMAGPASAQDDQNCYFSSQAAAQESYRSLALGQEYIGPEDADGPITTPDQFDPDQDGVACEDYTGPWAPSDDDENRRMRCPCRC